MLELTPLKNPLTISRHPGADVDITGGLKRGSNAGGLVYRDGKMECTLGLRHGVKGVVAVR
jgi:hypothetical protein